MATEFISNSWLMPTNANAEANRVSNYSLDCDGSSQYLNISDVSSIATNTQGSISFWLNFAGDSSTRYAFGISDTNANTFLAIGINSSENLDIIHREAGINLWRLQTTGSAIVLNTWQHICLTQNGTACEVYVNGVKPTQSGAGTEWLSSLSGLDLLTIGALYKSSALVSPIEGKITEVSFFDYSLSSSQITQLYGTGSAIGNPMAITNGRKPVAYYPLGNAVFNSEFLVPNGAEQDFVFSFDGSLTKITFSEITFSTASTLSAWAKRNTTANMFLFGNTNSGGYGCYFVGTSGVYVQGSGGYFAFTNSAVTTAMSRTDWVNWVFIKDSSTNLLSVYVDGVLAQSTTSAAGMDSLTSIGGSGLPTGNQFIWDGLVSNVSLFNTALPATGTESVASLYNYGTPPNIASYSNLQGWWELDASATFDGSNWSIPDASSNSNTGTSSGMTAANLILSDLVINQSYDPFSLSFDGVDDFISVYDGTAGGGPSSLKFTSTDSFSISCWINMLSSSGQENIISFRGTPLIWFYRAGTTIGFRIRGNGSGTESAITKTTTNSAWHNIVAIRDYNGGSPQLKLYIDNVAATPVTDNTSGDFDTYDKFSICNDNHSGGRYWYDGKISNLSIYNSALTSAQVKTLYNEGKPFDLNTFEVTPVAWWRLGASGSSFDGTNWTVLDEIGTSNGTSANMTQADLVDGVGATGSGTSSGMSSGTNRTGDAPYSDNNAVSYNMSVTAKSSSTPT